VIKCTRAVLAEPLIARISGQEIIDSDRRDESVAKLPVTLSYAGAH
jgi:hypothetical protein